MSEPVKKRLIWLSDADWDELRRRAHEAGIDTGTRSSGDGAVISRFLRQFLAQLREVDEVMGDTIEAGPP